MYQKGLSQGPVVLKLFQTKYDITLFQRILLRFLSAMTHFFLIACCRKQSRVSIAKENDVQGKQPAENRDRMEHVHDCVSLSQSSSTASSPVTRRDFSCSILCRWNLKFSVNFSQFVCFPQLFMVLDTYLFIFKTSCCISFPLISLK